MQRMLFARLLLQDARVIVLDEPFNAVDAKTSADLFDLVRRWHGEQRTVLAALHDIDFVRPNFPRRCCSRVSRSPGARPQDVLTAENLLTARRMCEAFDEHAAEACVAEPVHADALMIFSSRRSRISSSCAARWPGRWRWRSAPDRSACS